LSVFQFLDGSVIKDGVDGLWERLRRALPTRPARGLGHFARKFYAVPYAVKDYHNLDDTLDTCAQCLVFRHRLGIDYRGLLGEGKVHEFDPYTRRRRSRDDRPTRGSGSRRTAVAGSSGPEVKSPVRIGKASLTVETKKPQ
jgi:hypothetical protein